MRILAIGAHFDDIEIGCAGTLIQHIKKGDIVHIAITSSDEDRTGDVLERIYEQQNAIDIMGFDPGKYVYLFAESDTDADIIGPLDTIDPDIIYCHYEKDTHQAHRRSSIISQAIGRKQHITTIFYDSGSSYEFYPNAYSLIDYKMKENVLKCYKSQIIHGAINLDRVKKKNSFWATMITDDPNAYAEGFIIRKMKYMV